MAKEHLDIMSFVMPLLLDGYTHAESENNSGRIMSEALRLGLMTPEAEMSYCVLVTALNDRNGVNITSKTTVNSIDLILKKYINHVSFYIDGRVISLLYATRRTIEKYIHIAVEDITQSVLRIMDCDSRIGISRIGDAVTNLHELYVEAMNAISYNGAR